MLYRVLMAFVFFSLNVVSRSVLFRSRLHPNVRMLVSRRNGRPSDFIDVEVDDKSESGRAGGEKFEALSKETREKKGLLSGVGGFLASKFPILKLINKSEDKESIQKREVMCLTMMCLDYNSESKISLPRINFPSFPIFFFFFFLSGKKTNEHRN